MKWTPMSHHTEIYTYHLIAKDERIERIETELNGSSAKMLV